MKLNRILILGAMLITAAGCSSNSTQPEKAARSGATPPVSKQVLAAKTIDRSIVVTVEFKEGQDGLDPLAAKQIQKTIDEARASGKLKNIEVAAWSDMQYPLPGRSLPKTQIKLADRRAKTVEKFVESVDSAPKVTKHNMAKQPNAFQKWVYTRDAEVKNKLASAGIVARDSSEMIPDRKSIAMVFIEIE